MICMFCHLILSPARVLLTVPNRLFIFWWISKHWFVSCWWGCLFVSRDTFFLTNSHRRATHELSQFDKLFSFFSVSCSIMAFAKWNDTRKCTRLAVMKYVNRWKTKTTTLSDELQTQYIKIVEPKYKISLN